MKPSSIAPQPVESREAPTTPQDPSPLRGTLGSSLRSPAEVEGNAPPDRERRVNSPALSARGSRPSPRTSDEGGKSLVGELWLEEPQPGRV